MYQDTKDIIYKFEKHHKHAPIPRKAGKPLITICNPCLFAHWGVDIAGLFPEAPRKGKFLLVGIDYFIKWVEAEPLITATKHNIVKFFWKKIICQFGIPHTLISDNET